MKNATAREIRIGDLFMGKIDGESVTFEVTSDPIPGNELRAIVLRPSGKPGHIGARAIRRAVWIGRSPF